MGGGVLAEQRDPTRLNRWLALAVIVLGAVVLLTGGATAYLWWQRPAAEAAGIGGQVALVAGDLLDNLDLYLADATGNVRQRLTNTPENELYPVWSPDGSKLAFVRINGLDQSSPQREWEPNEGLYWLRFDEKQPMEEQLLLASEGGIGVPGWSPDGRYLLIVAPVDDADSESFESRVTLIDAATKQRQTRMLPFLAVNEQPSWSPSDGAVAVAGLVMDQETGQPVQKLHLLRRDRTQTIAENVRAAAFSPAEPLLACLNGGQGAGLRLIQPDGIELRTLLPDDYILGFAWSPDGTTLAIARMADEQNGELLLYRLADDSTTVIPLGEQRFLSHMSWSPDGRFLVYTFSDFTKASEVALPFAIGIVDVRAGTVMPFAQQEPIELLGSWRPASTESVSADSAAD